MARLALHDTLNGIEGLTGGLQVVAEPRDQTDWIFAGDLGDPDAGPLKALFDRFAGGGFGSNRRAVAASLLLRYGWGAGGQIAAYLALGRTLRLTDFALQFSASTLIKGVWVREAEVGGLAGDPLATACDWTGVVAPQALRLRLLESLVDFTAPLVDSQHAWSRFSRHALWAQVASSWAAQFAAIGERIGERAWAVAEGREILALHPEIAAAAPEVYEVRGGRQSKVCQRRAACCLYFKGPRRHFCASCPIIPVGERLQRNRQWADSYPSEPFIRPAAQGPAALRA